MLLQSHDGAVHLLPSLPTSWSTGEVTGLKARGDFEVSMNWQEGKLCQATIRSGIGGVIRLRSYTPLKGAGLTKAKGACPNPLYAPAEVKTPLLSSSLAKKPSAELKTVYEYDLRTEAGKEYKVFQANATDAKGANKNSKRR